MNIHLTPELETLVQNKVKSGRYNSASEVVREALRLFEERDRLRELQIRDLQWKINEGWASLERGEGVNGEEFFRGLERQRNGSWGASANGHEAFQTLARSRGRCSGNPGPHRRGQRQSRPPSSSPDF